MDKSKSRVSRVGTAIVAVVGNHNHSAMEMDICIKMNTNNKEAATTRMTHQKDHRPE